MALKVQHFLHDSTGTFSYVAWDDSSRQAAVIDPVLDYDPATGRTSVESVAQIAAFVDERELELQWVLETHAHADHLSAAVWLKQRYGCPVGIGSGIRTVQKTFSRIFHLPDLAVDGSQFDRLFSDDEHFMIGDLQGRIIATPGHTSDSVSYLIGDAVFVGDSLFAPDKGTARTDFPGGDAHVLYRSTQRILSLPAETRVYLCHDYPGSDREHEHEHSVAEHRDRNIHVGEQMTEEAFVAVRTRRDATLDAPRLILPAVQVNIRAGELPPPEANGTRYLKIPLNVFGQRGDADHD